MTDFEMKEWLETQYVLVDDCWVWQGHKNNGYGHLYWKRALHYVHRLYWLLSGRTIPEGLEMCHGPGCIKACFNPNHLTPGTHAENMADTIRDGTNNGPQGEKHGSAKLTEEQVKAIRASTKTHRTLAKEYGVVKSTIDRIINRQIWAHI